ncbi:hypothetical protein KJ988_03785, partial [bacterium]|nr:hypothetical protein [bacterium]MBU4110099.1 hypothetical protein [bacterium]
TNDIKDHDTYESTTMGVGIGTNDNKPSLNSFEYTNNTKDKEQINRATVGKGILTTDSDTTNLNRDTSKTQQITKDESSNLELYASDKSINALMDPEKALNNIQQSAKDVGLAAHKEIVENLPSASKGKDGKGDFIDNTVGTALDTLGTLTLGAIPNAENDGGYVSQIATQLFGDNRQGIIVKDKSTLLEAGVTEKDIQEVTLVKTKDGVKKVEDLKPDDVALDRVIVYRTNPDKSVVIGNPEDKTGNPNLEAYKIRLSAEDIKNSGIDHLFTNGMFNSSETAAYNQQTQQGYADSMLNYNQQHGIIGDFIENAQDYLALNTGATTLSTGGARQTGERVTQMTEITQGDLTVGAHSQGTLMTQNGMTLNKEELSNIVQNNPESKFLVGYAGSPVNHNDGEALVRDIYGGEEAINDRFNNEAGISNAFRSQVNPQDLVGSLLGWQSAGVNQSENILTNVGESILRTPSLFVPTENNPSAHSYYPCVIGCGEKSITPKMDTYYNPSDTSNKQQTPLEEYYKTLNVDLNLYTKERK